MLSNRPTLNPASNSFNTRRAAQGRPTLVSMATDSPSASSLKLNLENLGRPRFDPKSQTFVTDQNAPHTLSGNAIARSSPLIRKKSGELVKSSLKVSAGPTYESNPLSASSNASTEYSASSPFAGSKSLPTTPSCPKYVHFDTRLERVRLFLSEQKPAAVSRTTSPNDENGPGGSGSEGGEFPFPTTSDEEENARRSLAVVLPNFPLHQPFDADVSMVSIALTEDGRHLRGTIHVRNLAFNKRVCVRFTSDCWSTTSEVAATYQDSIKSNSFDRFQFQIKLQDLMARIEEKTLFLAIRYNVDNREIWDSNDGQNYKVEFKKNKPMKAAELREARKAGRLPGQGAGGKPSEWTDKGGNGGPSADRMADLKAQLSRLAADDYDEEGISGLAPPKALLSPGVGPASPLAARYDFGASLKNTTKVGSSSGSSSLARNYGTGWDGSPPSAERQLSDLSPDGRNGTLLGAGAYPLSQSFGSTPAPAEGGAMGLRFDPSLSFGSPGLAAKSTLPRTDGLPPTGLSNYDRTHPASFGSSREPDPFASSARSTPGQPQQPAQQPQRTFPPAGTFSPPPTSSSLGLNSSISSASPGASRHHSRSAYGTQSLDYFSAASVRRTPPASPRVEAMGNLPEGSGGARIGGARFNSFPTGRGYVSPYTEAPPTLSRNMFGSSSSSSIGSGGGLDSPASQASTPSMTASSGGTPSDSPMSEPSFPIGQGYDPSLSMPRSAPQNLGGVSYSDFVNQYCFFTGGSSTPAANVNTINAGSPGIVDDNYRTPSQLTAHPSVSSSSVDSFFSAGPSSGFNTPTNARSPPQAAHPASDEYFGHAPAGFDLAGDSKIASSVTNGPGGIVHRENWETSSSASSGMSSEAEESATPRGGRSPYSAGAQGVRV